MSSKAEKTSHRSYQQPRLSIFFRNPLLLKIVAWLGSLSFIGSTGTVLADLKPVSTTKTETQALVQAVASATPSTVKAVVELEVYGPHFPVAQQPSPVRLTPAQAPNREVPIAVTPGSAAILPTGTIVRPQHTDLLKANNYTVGVNGSAPEEFINISVPAPRTAIIPRQTREVVAMTGSQLQPSYVKPPSVVSQAVPNTSIQSPARSGQSNNGFRAIPAVAKLPTLDSTSLQIGRSGASLPTSISSQRAPLAGIKPTVVTPMKPSVTVVKPQPAQATSVSTPAPAAKSVEIAVSAPRTQQIAVQPVAQLPQISNTRSVPTVPAMPSVRTSAGRSPSQLIALGSTGYESSSELIYPLSSPAPTTSSFGWRTHPITGSRRFHAGVDIGAPMGAPVVAAGSGIIISSGWNGGYGKAIVIQHNGVQQTLYGHLSEIFVQAGQRIEQGTVIGRVGSTGQSTGAHLHFESRVSTADGWIAVDPGDDIKYALDNLRRSAPFAQRDLPPGYN